MKEKLRYSKTDGSAPCHPSQNSKQRKQGLTFLGELCTVLPPQLLVSAQTFHHTKCLCTLQVIRGGGVNTQLFWLSVYTSAVMATAVYPCRG